MTRLTWATIAWSLMILALLAIGPSPVSRLIAITAGPVLGLWVVYALVLALRARHRPEETR